MQQLQSSYRGDSSPSLAQIFGIQYQPQQAIAQAANTAVGSGMSAGAQVKTTAMNNSTQMSIADANRWENARQYNLTNKLYNRNASENERHNMAGEANAERVTDWNTGGSIDATDRAAAGDVKAQIMEMELALQGLDKTDKDYLKKAEAITNRINGLRTAATGAGGTRGGLTGFAPRAGNMYGPKESFTTKGGKLLTAAGAAGDPEPPAPVPVLPEAPTPVGSISQGGGNGSNIGFNPADYNITPTTLGQPFTTQTLGGTIANATPTAPAPIQAASGAPAAPKNWWESGFQFGNTGVISPAPAESSGGIKLPDWFNPAGIR